MEFNILMFMAVKRIQINQHYGKPYGSGSKRKKNRQKIIKVSKT